MELRGRRVLVTGASRGIGEAMAVAFHAAGAKVALVARSADRIAELAEQLGGTSHPADLTDRTQVDGLVAAVEGDGGGPVDVLVNNAGLGTSNLIDRMAVGEIDAMVELNLRTPIALARQVLPGMLERRVGHIVNVSSLAGVTALAGLSLYSSTKAGLSHFTAGLRADLKGTPVGTTLVELGPVPTELLDDANEYPAAGAGFERGRKLHLLVDVTPQRVAFDVVDAVTKGRRHVRHPKRAVLFPMAAEAPRRISELLLRGIDPR